MDVVTEGLNSILRKNFFGLNPLPLPFYILYPLKYMYRKINVKILSLFAFILTRTIMVTYMKKKGVSGPINILIFLGLSISMYRKLEGVHVYFAEMFSFLALNFFIKKRYIVTSICLTLLSLTDSLFIPITLLLSSACVFMTYTKLLDPNNSVIKTIRCGTIVVFQLLPVPLMFSTLFIFLDLLIRNKHSKNSLSFPIEFQASLKNFNALQGFENAHGAFNQVPETDLYVMDRSIISLMSKKHNTFFTIENDSVTGTKQHTLFCEIQKVHDTDFENEEPRFIKNGDRVKLAMIESGRILGINKNKDKAEIESKFIRLVIDDPADNPTIWKVSTDGYLKTRFSEVAFISETDGYNLSARMVNMKPILYASHHSIIESRKFCIITNKNHEYFRKAFVDYRASITTDKYPAFSKLKKLWVLLKTLNIKFESRKNKDSIVTTLKCISLGCFTIILILLNEVLSEMYGIELEIGKETLVFTGAFMTTLLSSVVIGLRSYILSSFGLFALSSLINDIMSSRKGRVELTKIKKVQ